MGGRVTESGRLGAFITKVKKGSLADVVGHLRAGRYQTFSAVPIQLLRSHKRSYVTSRFLHTRTHGVDAPTWHKNYFNHSYDDQSHGHWHLISGDEVLQWNGKLLPGATMKEVYNIILESQAEPQVELVVSRPIGWVWRETQKLLTLVNISLCSQDQS